MNNYRTDEMEVKRRVEAFLQRKFKLPVSVDDEALNAVFQKTVAGGSVWLRGREQPELRLKLVIDQQSVEPTN